MTRDEWRGVSPSQVMRHLSPRTLTAIIAARMQNETQSHFSAIPWSPRDVLLGILAAAAGILGLNAILVAASALTGNALRDNGNVLSIFIIAQGLVLVGAVWLFGLRKYRAGWAQIGLRGFSARVGCAWVTMFFIASYFTRAVYIAIATALGVHFGVQQILTRLDTAGVGFLLTLFMGAVIAPIAEEIFFRGFMYGGLRARFGVAGAVIATSLFFAALHFSLEFLIPILVLGIFLALLYEVTVSLYPGMILHLSNNLIALVAYFMLKALGVSLPS